jgi:Regulator of G protein signaling domain
LTEIFTAIYDKLLSDDFDKFIETQKLVAYFESEKLALENSRSNSEQFSGRSSELRQSQKVVASSTTSTLSSNFENEEELDQSSSAQPKRKPSSKKKGLAASNRVAIAKAPKVLPVVTDIAPSLISQPTSPIDITLEKVLNNLTSIPYSRKDYRTFLEVSMSEENLDFLVAVLEYRKAAAKFYLTSVTFTKTAEMLEQAATLPQATMPEDMDGSKYQSELNTLISLAQDLANQYLKPQAPQEVNLPSKVLKPVLMLLETGHYNPEVFEESYHHIHDMLHQNGFEHFLKLASTVIVPPVSQEGI